VKNIIVYPSGSHGNFLSAVLNTMTGVRANNLGSMIYDKTTYTRDRNFVPIHCIGLLDPSVLTLYDNSINIYVRPESYLKYASVCLNRTSGVDIQLETLNLNTFEKLNQHVIFSQLLTPLSTISEKSFGDVEFKDLREWARLCLFADNGKTITQWITDTQFDRADYTFDFEWFYNADTLKEKSTELVTGLGMQVVDSIDHLMPDFYNNNRYRTIDQETDKIISAIRQGISYNIDNTNFFQEGYIDNWLVDTYQINPLYRNEYFKNTQEIIKEYNLI
jgi:hypothetical protein